MLVKLEWLGYHMVKKLWRYIKPFSSDNGTLWTDRQTDRCTDLLYQYRASVCWRVIKTQAKVTKICRQATKLSEAKFRNLCCHQNWTFQCHWISTLQSKHHQIRNMSGLHECIHTCGLVAHTTHRYWTIFIYWLKMGLIQRGQHLVYDFVLLLFHQLDS